MTETVQAQFRLIYERTKNDLFRLIRVRVGQREDALDILQDAYLEFFKALRQGSFAYRSDPETLGFLYIIAKRRIARFYRFRKVTLSLEDYDPESEDNAGRENIALLLDALRKLSDSDQEVVRLHYFSGLSFREIAALLNKEEGAIKIRHHRAITKLKTILGYDKR